MTPVPERFRAPVLHTVDSAMPAELVTEFGRRLFDRRDLLVRTGDDGAVDYFRWELDQVDAVSADLVASFRRRLLDHFDAWVGRPLGFELDAVDLFAALYHHGSHMTWHADRSADDPPAVAFAFYMHAEPCMFTGGELEFLDGTTVEPKNNRLVLYGAGQQHRVRPVECWSSHVLHGRWALLGWLRGRDRDVDGEDRGADPL